MNTMSAFISGGIMMGCWIAGLLFLRYWKRTRDRLFLILCTAFWLMGLERAALAAIAVENEVRTFVYVFRLFAFLLIVIGIIDKNRQAREG